MGGKVKQANRTKNNVRPSSSGRSAELISNKVDPSLVLMSPGKLLPTVFPSLGGSFTENLLSSEFLLCFKKFHKKDPITKIKAINELKDLVANSKQEEVVNALPSWAHYYPSLTVDIDRKVREATQVCHGAIVRKCGRQVAPHIKRLLPAWLLALHDDYAPAQLVAETDLNKTFPNEKLAEAIKFCKAEIYHLLMENLKGNSGFMLNGKNIEDEEEKEAQCARVIGCSLRALDVFMCRLLEAEPAAIDWLWDALLPLLCANSYWKLAAHKSHFVRSSWFCVTGSVVEKFGSRLPADTAQRAARVLTAAGTGATPSGPGTDVVDRWLAVLKFMHHVEDWSTHMNAELLTKRLLDVLNNAARGEARRVSGLVLPLVSLLPSHIITDHFYTQFFTALLNGLTQKTLHSKSEREHWNNLVAECIRYVSTRHHADDYLVGLIDFTIRKWLEVVVEPESQAKVGLIKSTTSNMANLAKFWYNKAKENELYEAMLEVFWTNIEYKLREQVEKLSTNQDDISNLIDAQTLFVTSLKTAIVSGDKKKYSIKFEDEINVSSDSTPIVIDCDASTTLQQNVTDIATKLISDYFDFARNYELNNNVIPRLMALIKEFCTKELFNALQGLFNVKSALDLYSNVFKQLLADKKLCCQAIVEVVFMLVQYLTEHEQDTVFQSFAELPPKIIEWCLTLALSYPYRSTAYVKKWMHSDVVNSTILGVCQREDEEARSVLLKALAHDSHGEMIVSDKTIGALIVTCNDMLTSLIDTDGQIISPDDGDTQKSLKDDKSCNNKGDSKKKSPAPDPLVKLEARVKFAGQLLDALPTDCTADTVPLLLTLFKITLNIPRGCSVAAAATDAWRAAAAELAADAARHFLTRALHYLHSDLMKNIQSLDIEHIENIVSLCPSLLIPHDGLPPPEDATSLVEQSRLVLQVTSPSPSPHTPLTPLHVFALQADIIWGNYYPMEKDNELVTKAVSDKCILTAEDFMLHAYTILFRALFVKAILLQKIGDDDDDDDDEGTWCDAMLRVTYFQEQFCNILHDCVVLDVLYDYYVFWRHYDIIREVKEHMDNIVRDIIKEISVDVNEILSASLTVQAKTHKYYWTYAQIHYKDLYTNVHNMQEVDKVSDQDKPEPEMSGLEIVGKNDTSGMNLDNTLKKLLFAEERPNLSDEEISLLLNMMEEVPKRILQYPGDISKKMKAVTLLCNYLYEIQMMRSSHHAMKTRKKLRADSQEESDKNDEQSADPSVRFAKNLAMMDSHSKLCEEMASNNPGAIQDGGKDEDYLDKVINDYYRRNETMLYERDIKDASRLQVWHTAAVVDVLCEEVNNNGWEASAVRWDFVNITLCSVLTSIHLSMHMWDTTQMAVLSRATLQLYCATRRFVRHVPREAERRQPSPHVAALSREWDDIFAPDTTKTIYLIICHVLDASSKDITLNQVAMIQSLMEASKYLEPKAMAAVLRTGQLSLERVVQCATRVLTTASHHGFMYLAYYTLAAVAPSLVDADEATLKNRPVVSKEEEEERDIPQLTLAWYDEPLTLLHELVDAILSSYTVCVETCELVARSDGAALAAACLLLALAAHAHAARATGDLALLYVTVFNSRPYVEYILAAAVRLLPAPVAAYMTSSTQTFPKHCLPYFNTPPTFSLHKECSAATISSLACYVVRCVLGGPGSASARGWWSALPSPASHHLQRLVTAAIAPALVAAQMQQLTGFAASLGPDVVVTTNPGHMWAMCSVTVEEQELSLRVQYSNAHPLHAPRLAAPHPAPDPHWLHVYLGYKNGRLSEAMRLWLLALGSKLGEATCCVCYCRLHPDGTAPSVPCRQCRNLFHNQCLRRWFRSSSRSSCPVCRTHF